MKVLMHALAASCEELRARTGNPPLDHGTIPGISFDSAATAEKSKSRKRFVRKDQKEKLEKKLLQYRKC